MATNVSFGEYTPPPPPKGTVDIRIGVFFDGTQNNRRNTQAGGNLSGYKPTQEEKDAYRKYSNKEDDSYMNDLSNVARKELHYKKEKYVDSVYIEGIGTDDLGADTDDKLDHLGVAFGAGKQGVIAKVRKGCELIAKKIKKLNDRDKINTLTLDVFGFSRGSAAARNFIYEISKNKYLPLDGTKIVGTGSVKIKTDDYKVETTEKEFPKNGHLGLQLKLKKIEYSRINIRFVGLYDTVSSYDPNATNTTINPDYTNDVKELHLNSLNLEVNDLYKAKKIIHFCAADEHRKNFMLTPTKRAGGQDFYLPGVHSDVGGCYTDKMDEDDVQIMDFDNVSGGRSDEEWDEILNNDLNDLIAQGWFKELEVVRPNYWHETHINRKGIRNTYSFVTLHLMAEKLNKEYAGTIKMTDLNKYFGIPKQGKPDELDLNKVKQRLEKYINGELPKMTYHTKPEIEKMRKKLDLKNAKEVENFNLKVYDHNMLNRLRSKYIHWNSQFGAISGAYLPNYKIVGKTIVRFRKIEPNS
ncbi:DUF2235 domain-containing protein [Chryseobacterium wangxinyae]|uniref:phospholipase effector Tle1 domain-containing protein n=1 Tax=Chryseobacterium sp. CY350 TaxID=2997336 RepID=UPI00226FC934|nr:DUF2235 domain-containing protein [Chryseobacterium sp. CY350]MCY0977831.1 DUF2235 domain-containing protein [Chryseobacterium sp. CY350]WBZ94919.1 DUF2235 domain-containing protein [Chryseobacterium sp. CY350]